MNVLVIAEDYRLDQYILKPLVEAMMKAAGKPRARVEMCRNPMLRGLPQVLNWDHLQEVTEVNPLADMYLLIVDRDKEAGRQEQLQALEAKAREVLPAEKTLLAVGAQQEVEAWLLAGHKLPRAWSWRAIREERDVKEHYYQPFAEQREVSARLGRGRKVLGEEAARNYNRVRQLCPEVAELDERIRRWLASHG